VTAEGGGPGVAHSGESRAGMVLRWREWSIVHWQFAGNSIILGGKRINMGGEIYIVCKHINNGSRGISTGSS
jgi:hypothetical protein